MSDYPENIHPIYFELNPGFDNEDIKVLASHHVYDKTPLYSHTNTPQPSKAFDKKKWLTSIGIGSLLVVAGVLLVAVLFPEHQNKVTATSGSALPEKHRLNSRTVITDNHENKPAACNHCDVDSDIVSERSLPPLLKGEESQNKPREAGKTVSLIHSDFSRESLVVSMTMKNLSTESRYIEKLIAINEIDPGYDLSCLTDSPVKRPVADYVIEISVAKKNNMIGIDRRELIPNINNTIRVGLVPTAVGLCSDYLETTISVVAVFDNGERIRAGNRNWKITGGDIAKLTSRTSSDAEILEALKNKDAKIRLSALKDLEKSTLRRSEKDDILKAKLHDSNLSIRLIAMRIVGSSGAVPHDDLALEVVSMLEKGLAEEEARTACETLGQLQYSDSEGRSVNAIWNVLRRPDSLAHTEAAEALTQLKGARTQLDELLKGDSGEIVDDVMTSDNDAANNRFLAVCSLAIAYKFTEFTDDIARVITSSKNRIIRGKTLKLIQSEFPGNYQKDSRGKFWNKLVEEINRLDPSVAKGITGDESDDK